MNTSMYNESNYNWAVGFVATTLDDDIIFNGLGLQNENIKTSKNDDDNFPKIDINKFQNPIIDGGGVLGRRYREKDINLRGYLKADTPEELNNLIDLFKQKTSAVEGYLDIKTNGIYRRTKATVVREKVFAREHYHITAVPFDITFQTLEPFSYNREDETITDTDITGNHSMEFTYFGNAPSSPRVYLTFADGGGTDEMIFELNNSILTVNRTMNNGDILLFDSIEKTVKVNGEEIDYLGKFPQLIYGDNLFDFKINGTPLLDITILYATNYL